MSKSILLTGLFCLFAIGAPTAHAIIMGGPYPRCTVDEIEDLKRVFGCQDVLTNQEKIKSQVHRILENPEAQCLFLAERDGGNGADALSTSYYEISDATGRWHVTVTRHKGTQISLSFTDNRDMPRPRIREEDPLKNAKERPADAATIAGRMPAIGDLQKGQLVHVYRVETGQSLKDAKFYQGEIVLVGQANVMVNLSTGGGVAFPIRVEGGKTVVKPYTNYELYWMELLK